jgi:hypothetical protein
MSARPKRGFWLICRIYFRRFRIALWFFFLAVILGMIWLNQVGVPNWVKARLVAHLQQRGLDLQFTRMRLVFYQGLVADNVRIGQADDPESPHFTAAEVLVDVRWSSLLRWPVQRDALVDSLVLRQGRLVWPMGTTNGVLRVISLDDISTELRFLPEDEWSLEHFAARFAGGKIELSGRIAHASAVREWSFPKPAQAAQPSSMQPGHPGAAQRRLRDLADALDQIRFSTPPRLNVDVRGDARDPQSFKLRLALNAAGESSTPWGRMWNGYCTARILPRATNGQLRAEVNVMAERARTPWGSTTNLQIAVQLSSQADQPDRANGELLLAASRSETEWARADSIRLWVQWVHSFTNPIPLVGQTQLRCERVRTGWADTEHLSFSGNFSSANESVAKAGGAAWGWWTNLAPYQVDWECLLKGARVEKVDAEEFSFSGRWSAPELLVTNLQARVSRSRAEFHARLDVGTRELSLRLATRIDPHRFAPLFAEPVRKELAACTWPELPRLEAEAGLVFPEWDLSPASDAWPSRLLPTIWAMGGFDLAEGAAYREVGISRLKTSFVYTNGGFRLPDLTIARPEGRLALDVMFTNGFRNLHARVSSGIDWRMVRPLLDEESREGVDLVEYQQPPRIEGELWERLDAPEQLGFLGRVSATNFSVRGESARSLETELAYTNGVVLCTRLKASLREGQVMTADALRADFPADVIIVTNGYSTADPMAVTRAIGAHVARVVAPYQFSNPPTARVYGVIPLHGLKAADLHFELDGGPFHWWRFNVPHISGQVHWRGLGLTITEVRSDFYGGQATGGAAFDFSPAKGDFYQFNLTTTNTILQAMMADLSPKTNVPEGRLSGTLVITNANTADDQILDGYGTVELKDGLIWDIPIFGVFSPILDGIVPGLGHSRAGAAKGTFVITNAVIRSDDLQIHAPAMRLAYKGTVDMHERVDARVEAELLRDVWLVGPVMRATLWPFTKMFEYKVTGTLDEPKTEPLRPVTKMILTPLQIPFHPWRSLKGLFQETPTPQGHFEPLDQ